MPSGYEGAATTLNNRGFNGSVGHSFPGASSNQFSPSSSSPMIEPSPVQDTEWLRYAQKFVDMDGQTQWKCLWRKEAEQVCYYWGESLGLIESNASSDYRTGKKQLVKRHIEGSHLKIK